jgi:TPR repeat protein
MQTQQTDGEQLLGEADFKKGMVLVLRSKFRASLPFFLRSAASQFPPAYVRLGGLYSDGGLIGPKDAAESEKWFSKAVENLDWFIARATGLGDGETCQLLGRCYYHLKDFKNAHKWYQVAAQQQHPLALNNLGFLYQAGEGVQKDEQLAFQHFLKSAEYGYVTAMFSLGYCYRTGKGCPQDDAKAVYYYQMAAEQGKSVIFLYFFFVWKNGCEIVDVVASVKQGQK